MHEHEAVQRIRGKYIKGSRTSRGVLKISHKDPWKIMKQSIKINFINAKIIKLLFVVNSRK